MSAFRNLAPIVASILLCCPSMTLGAPATRTRVVTTRSAGVNPMPIWSKSVKVPYRAWIPVDKPRQVLLCVHGLGFSSASFAEFGRLMAGRGLAVYAIDVRGFGAWMDRPDDQLDFEACLSDIESALHTLRKAYPKTSILIVGESMGGAIALRETSRNPDLVDGLICAVPSSDRYRKLSSELIVGARYVTEKNKPMSLDTEVVNRATADPKLRKEMENNPNNRMKLSAKQLKQFNDFMKGNEDAAALIQNTPTIMLAGFKDKLVKPEGTIDLFNEVSTQDKLLLVVGDGEHLLLEENQLTPEIEQLLLQWIKMEARTPGTRRAVAARQ